MGLYRPILMRFFRLDKKAHVFFPLKVILFLAEARYIYIYIICIGGAPRAWCHITVLACVVVVG